MRQVSSLLGVGVRGYVFVLRGTLLLMQLFIIYYGLSQLSDVRQSLVWPFLRQTYWCAILVPAITTAAYGSEILWGRKRLYRTASSRRAGRSACRGCGCSGQS